MANTLWLLVYSLAFLIFTSGNSFSKEKPKYGADIYWANYWSGEYPGPVVNIKKETLLNVFSSYKLPSKDKTCTVLRGQYHPWTKSPKREVVQGNKIRKYKLTSNRHIIQGPLRNAKLNEKNKKHTNVNLMIRKNAQVDVLSYFSEGVCLLRVGKQHIESDCPNTKNFTLIAPKKPQEHAPLQFFKAGCKEGGKVWVKVEGSLFKKDTIEKGSIVQWGQTKALPEHGQKFAASFPCSKASTRTEKLICSNDSLSQYDLRL
ncbi:hypothetical protein N9W79_02435, partial [bacterium]|nr:hypothetical protein [bacterium]